MPRRKKVLAKKIYRQSSSNMSHQLELLINLHDLDLLIQESKDCMSFEADIGFKVQSSGLKKLEEAKAVLEKQIEKEYLEHYEKLSHRGRPVVPVVDDVCYGCFMRLPTSFTSQTLRNAVVSLCENCGRFLYWVN